MKFPDRKYIYIASASVLLLLLIYFGLFRTAPVTVETGLVSRGKLISTVDAEGRTRYHERYTIKAPISGKMFRITLHEGDRVPKGYILTRIDPTPPRPLDPSQTPPSGVYAYAYNVYVPEDGILTKIFITSEGMIEAGAPIAEVSKPSQLEIVADVISADATRIKPRMPVLIENWGGDQPVKAKVRLVEPQAFTKVSSLGVEEQRVNVIADFDGGPPSRLGDNYRVDMRVVLWEGDDIIRVPTSALFRQGEDWYVFLNVRSNARLQKVEIGNQSPSFAQVLSGLADGDVVILHPPNSVADGTRVDVK